MPLTIRKADSGDVPAVAAIYDRIHAAEEAGRLSTGWIRGIYPVLKTAEASQARGDLFVMADGEKICGSAIINQEQCEAYSQGQWQIAAPDSAIMVLHTLCIDPQEAGRGLGRKFMEFYASHALANGCECLRMDTNARNSRARAFYARLGFREAGMVHLNFNGIEGVNLVLLERDARISFCNA